MHLNKRDLSQKLDETVLSRFWSSLNQPLKPAIQCWTTIPIYSSRSRQVQRVVEREVRFFDLDNSTGFASKCWRCR